MTIKSETTNKAAKARTVEGVTYRADIAKNADNLEVLEILGELEDGKPYRIKKLFELLFQDECENVLNQLKNEKGIVSASGAADFIAKVFEEYSVKN